MKKNSKDFYIASAKWTDFYTHTTTSKNYHPENFVSRILTSTSPVHFIEDVYFEKKILDLGCGHGRHIPYLSSLGFNVCGMEVSQEQVDELSVTFPNNHFLLGKSSDIPVRSNQFDYILACNSIYYLDDFEKGFNKHMKECSRILKPKGKIIFSMLGEKHSIFKNSVQQKNSIRLISEDFLQFREGVLIRPYLLSDKNEDLFSGFTIEYQGEIVESVGEYCRHIHYFLGTNK